MVWHHLALKWTLSSPPPSSVLETFCCVPACTCDKTKSILSCMSEKRSPISSLQAYTTHAEVSKSTIRHGIGKTPHRHNNTPKFLKLILNSRLWNRSRQPGSLLSWRLTWGHCTFPGVWSLSLLRSLRCWCFSCCLPLLGRYTPSRGQYYANKTYKTSVCEWAQQILNGRHKQRWTTSHNVVQRCEI